MKSNDRTPMRLGKNFKAELMKLQAKILLSKGVRYSLSDISDMITKTDSFKQIETELENLNRFVLKIDDRRRRLI